MAPIVLLNWYIREVPGVALPTLEGSVSTVAAKALPHLSASDVQWLAQNGQRRTVEEGQVIVREGAVPDAFHVVLEGALTVTRKRALLATLTPGCIVGEMSLLTGEGAVGTVKASGASVVYTISRRKLASQLAQKPAFGARFVRMAAAFAAQRYRGQLGEPWRKPNARTKAVANKNFMMLSRAGASRRTARSAR